MVNISEFMIPESNQDDKSINENLTEVHTFTASKEVNWSISGGSDQSKFEINSNGTLNFKIAPDFEVPTDSDYDNIYNVKIRATDLNQNFDEHIINITIINLDEGNMIYSSDISSPGKIINESNTLITDDIVITSNLIKLKNLWKLLDKKLKKKLNFQMIKLPL